MDRRLASLRMPPQESSDPITPIHTVRRRAGEEEGRRTERRVVRRAGPTPNDLDSETPQTATADNSGIEGGADVDVEDVEDADDGEEVEEMEDDAEVEEESAPEKPPPPLPPNVREISNLASWTVSTHKPGCGVAALLSPSLQEFWQSDGPQPHLLNIHFFKFVSIVHMRIYLDFAADESYTPTKMTFLAGTGHHDLQEFMELSFKEPKGWIEVDLSGVSEGEAFGGDVLRAHLVQVRVAENHQNGKDTHVRGVQIYARDEEARGRIRKEAKGVEGLATPDWMTDDVLLR